MTTSHFLALEPFHWVMHQTNACLYGIYSNFHLNLSSKNNYFCNSSCTKLVGMFSHNSPLNCRSSGRQNIALTQCDRVSLLIIFAIFY
jgi:hypothetical protein